MYVAHDSVDIFCVFLLRVSVVETQIAGAAEFLGCAEIHYESLGMANMQISVRFGRETSAESAAVFACREIILYFLLHKV